MKRITAILMFMVLLMLAAASTALADTLYQTNYFEMSLPDGWKYIESKKSYGLPESSGGQRIRIFDSTEDPIDVSDFDAVLNHMLTVFNLGTDYKDWEEITIDGQRTPFITIRREGLYDYYVTSIRSGSHVCYAAFYGYNRDYEKDLFKEMAQRLHVRDASDALYFRYGNADVKLRNYRTKTVNGKMYLLIDFTWKNAGNQPDMFIINVDVKAYQDGIELHKGYLFDVNTETGTSIMPGKELTVTEIFQLRSKSGKITLILDKLIDATNEWPSQQYEFTLK